MIKQQTMRVANKQANQPKPACCPWLKIREKQSIPAIVLFL
jgi:hypothetical protein